MSRTGRSENEPFSAQQCRTERAGRSTVIGFAPIGFALLCCRENILFVRIRAGA